MSVGIALTDADRKPWLERLRAELDQLAAAGEPVVLTCSALKKDYRDILRRSTGTVGFVHLRAGRAELAERFANGNGHFFLATLIASQLDTLEEPNIDEHALTVTATELPGDIIEHVLDA